MDLIEIGNNKPIKDIDMKEFTKVSLKGNVIVSKPIKIIKTLEAKPGYKLILPFEYEERKIIFIDYGWFPNEINIDEALNIVKDDDQVEGIIYYGDKESKYTHNDLKKGMFLTMHTKELKKYINVSEDYKVRDEYMVKRINFNSTNKTQKSEYPIIPFTDDLLIWYITPDTHLNYSRFWFFVSFGNLITNLYVWIFL